MIPFHRPSIGVLEQKYAQEALTMEPVGSENFTLSGGGSYTARARELFLQKTGVPDILLVTSCTHALELAALVCGIQPGDEVILPSYTFTSTANAFLLRGARLVFCEIDPGTMNIDVNHMEQLITDRTRAVVVMHYAGVTCDMDAVCRLSRKHGFFAIEDSAQAVGSTYNGRPAGTLSDIGCYSFHETKNYTCGEGGGVVFSDRSMRERAEIVREKGTDRNSFLRGEVERYTWRDIGSSYALSDILAAVLSAQLERFDEIMQKRMAIWNSYHDAFEEPEQLGLISRPFVPGYAGHNAHMYYIMLPTPARRRELMDALHSRGINATTHYEPLHASRMGQRLGYTAQDLPLTTEYAARLLRLPLYTDMPAETDDIVIEAVRTELHSRC